MQLSMTINYVTKIALTLIERLKRQAFRIPLNLLTASLLLSACAQSPNVAEQVLVPVPEAQAVSVEGERLEKQFLGALSEMEAGEYTVAAAALSELVKDVPDEAVYWANYALSQYKNGNLQAALLSIDTCLKMQPRLKAALNLKAVMLIEMGKVPEAEKLMLDTVAKYPDSPQLYYNLALLYDTYFQDANNAALYYQRYLNIVKEDVETARWLKQIRPK